MVRSLERPVVTGRAARPMVRSPCSARERALLEADGRRTELRPRLAEILALLCANPHGLSADALCADLHGDRGSASGVHVEVSRLRKLIGPWIDTQRYRLTCDVETDVRRVEGLLEGRGRARGGRGLRRPAVAVVRCARAWFARASTSTPGCARR